MSSQKIRTYKDIEYDENMTENLLQELENDEVIGRNDWKTRILTNMKVYTPEKFILIATKHADLPECDVVQAAENLWGAAASAVKLFCLQCGVDLKSHNVKEVFVKFAGFTANTKKLLSWSEYNQFTDGWEVANSHFYEHDGIQPVQIHKMIEAVAKFVNILASWNPKDFENDLVTALSDPNLKLTLKYMQYKKKFAEREWPVNLQVGSKPAKIGPKI